jgi:hypothetical protein
MDDYQNPKPGNTYISPALPSFGDKERMVRIATKVLPTSGGLEFVKERDEVVVRYKENAATIITAKFLEDARGVFVLSVQKFMADTGMPRGSGFSFVGDEIDKFCDFLAGIQSIQFSDRRGVKTTDEELSKITLNSAQASRLVAENEELFAEVLRHSLTKKDVVAIAYRRRQLGIFESLIGDPVFFESLRKKKDCTFESLWQRFFEKNPWIFGYGLSYVYSSGLDEKRLEQVVRGFHVGQSGKRVDGLLKTRALVSTLCFVEIKTHQTPLLQSRAYRAGCWAPSEEMVGAVAQIQGSVSAAAEAIFGRLTLKDEIGNPTGEQVFNFAPRSFVVVGSMSQFCTDLGVNEEKLRSFELYRRNIIQPEVITFDELYERAKHIVEMGES